MTMRLPASDEVPAPRLGGRNGRPTVEPLRLLLVDDDAAVRARSRRQFEDDGHVVNSVGDGRIALTAIEVCRYDLVIVDFAMPVMDGAAVIREGAQAAPGQKFLMVTGYSDSEAVAAACPDTPVMRKPFDNDAMRGRVVDLTA